MIKKQLQTGAKGASANGTLDPCKAPPCCYLQVSLICNAVKSLFYP